MRRAIDQTGTPAPLLAHEHVGSKAEAKGLVDARRRCNRFDNFFERCGIHRLHKMVVESAFSHAFSIIVAAVPGECDEHEPLQVHGRAQRFRHFVTAHPR